MTETESPYCECSAEGVEPFWYQFPDGRIGCKRCRKPQGYMAPPPPDPEEPEEPPAKARKAK